MFSILLVLASIVFLAIWSIIYILTMYKYDVVYWGLGDATYEAENGAQHSNYMDQDKSGYIIVECLWLLIQGAFYIYFYSVMHIYHRTYDKY